MSDITSDDISQFTDHTGKVRSLIGMRPCPAHLVGAFRRYGDANELIDESTIVDFELPEPFAAFDQQQTSSCNAHSAVEGDMISAFVQGNMQNAPLDPWSIYALLTGGSDVGSSIEAALELLMTWGAPTWGTIPPWTFNPSEIPKETDADQHKVEFGEMLTTRQEIMTAIARHEPLNFSVRAGKGFDNPNPSGLVQLTPGPCNHSITGWGGKRTNPQTGATEVKILNHWGKDWCLNGWGWVDVDQLMRGRNLACYRVKSVNFGTGSKVTIPEVA